MSGVGVWFILLAFKYITMCAWYSFLNNYLNREVLIISWMSKLQWLIKTYKCKQLLLQLWLQGVILLAYGLEFFTRIRKNAAHSYRIIKNPYYNFINHCDFAFQILNKYILFWFILKTLKLTTHFSSNIYHRYQILLCGKQLISLQIDTEFMHDQ